MSQRITTSAFLLLLLGLGAAAGLIVWHGAGDVMRAFAAAGLGLVGVALFHIVVVALDTLGLRALIAARHRPSYARLVWMQWIGEAVNSLLPVAQIGGEFVKSRLLHAAGIPGPRAGAYVVVNLTLGVFAQILFTLLGIALLVAHYGNEWGMAENAAIGVGLFVVLLVGFFAAQRFGLFLFATRLLERLVAGREWLKLVGGAKRLDAAIRLLYRKRRVVALGVFWQFVAWITGLGEVWLILHFMGRPVSVLDALLLESLGQAVRAAGFIVPGALGVQEGGFLVLGAVVGLAPDAALALSLGKRFRELFLGVPGFLGWQYAEGRKLARRRKAAR